MFSNIGGFEVLVVAIVALIAVGPEQLPSVIRRIGRSAAKARAVTNNIKNEFMAGLDDSDVDAFRQMSKDPGSFLMGTGTDDDPVVPRQARSNDGSSQASSDSKPHEGGEA